MQTEYDLKRNPDRNRRPVPVIMAASRQRRLWPLSTPSNPFCMREIGGRSSLLLRNLQAIEATAAFDCPIVILAEEAAMRGTMEVRRIRPDARIIVVPSGTGSGLSAILAAIVAGESPLAMVPASFTADDPVDAHAFVAEQTGVNGDQPLILSLRPNGTMDGMFLELAGRNPANTELRHLASLAIRGNGELAAVLEATKSLGKASGPVMIGSNYLVERMRENWPTLLSACRNAMALKQVIGDVIRPNGDFLRLAGRPGIRDLLQAVLNETLTVLGKPDWRTVQNFKDPYFDNLNSELPISAGVCGYPDHRLISSQDGILVLKPGHEDEAKRFYPDNQTEVPRSMGHARYPYIRFSA